MDIMSLTGIIASVLLICYGMYDGGNILNFLSSGAAAVTVGGTFAALMLAFPLKVFASLPKMLAKIFMPGKYNIKPEKYVEIMAELAGDAKKHGVLYLENKLHEYNDGFLEKSVRLAVDDEAPETIREIMETELGYMIERHKSGVRFFEKGAVYAPGFGMLGTISGIINMLAASENPIKFNNVMAAALVAVFYGLILANAVFLPMGNKLRKMSDDEVLCRQLIIEGAVAIANGDPPKQIRGKLTSYIPPEMRNQNGINDKTKEKEI